jgi:hypothetical protein
VPDVLRRLTGAYATDRPATLGVNDLREVLLIKSMEWNMAQWNVRFEILDVLGD